MSEIRSFSDLNIDEDILDAVRDLGYERPTDIQARCIDTLLEGNDLIGQSQTGTGKTAAFAIPMIELIDPDDRRLQGVVLCPTRELCIQNAEEIRKLLKFKAGIRVVSVYGGEPINYQINDIRKGVHILTATPGRLLDHLRRHTLRLDQIQMVVLDEADEMLRMGFREDMDLLLSQMPVPRQTVLFSATMPEDVAAIAREYMEDPVEVRTTPQDKLTVEKISQKYYDIKAGAKTDALCRLLDLERPDRAIVFVNTKKKAADLAGELIRRDYPVDALHGDLKQVQRDLVMRRFKKGDLKLLVATDVAARGLDISGVDAVFNYDLPEEPEHYVHRIGRTGRAGREGRSFTFIVGKEINRLADIQAYAGTELEPSRLPTLQDVEEAHCARFMQDIRDILKGTDPSLPSPEKYTACIRELEQEGYAPSRIAAAVMAKALYVPSSSDPLAGAPARIISNPDTKVKLHLNLGRKHKLYVKDIIGALTTLCGIPRDSIGHIDILESFSYVEVPASAASDILKLMNGKEIKQQKVRVSPAENKN
ncbi:MAG: DEAD/DEAH box helicase [Lachnospiraceae bacterium]|nr:DEAD/DEAH box helicase [Lachnospiraceae bacterium]